MIKTIKCKTKLIIWKILDFLLAILPLAIYVIIKRKQYFSIVKEESSRFVNIIGFISIIIFLSCIILKKTKLLKGVCGFWVATAVLYFLRYIGDVWCIALYAAIGATISKFSTHLFVEKWTKICNATMEAEIKLNVNKELQDERTNKIIEAISKINGRG